MGLTSFIIESPKRSSAMRLQASKLHDKIVLLTSVGSRAGIHSTNVEISRRNPSSVVNGLVTEASNFDFVKGSFKSSRTAKILDVLSKLFLFIILLSIFDQKMMTLYNKTNFLFPFTLYLIPDVLAQVCVDILEVIAVARGHQLNQL
jgi:hypothetical protein